MLPGPLFVAGWGQNQMWNYWPHVPGGCWEVVLFPMCTRSLWVRLSFHVTVERIWNTTTGLEVRAVSHLWEGRPVRLVSHPPGAWRAKLWWLIFWSPYSSP